MIEEIRNEFDDMFNDIIDRMQLLENIIEKFEEEEVDSIKNVNDFKFKLKQESFYTKELEQFIDNYIKYYN